MFDIIGDIHGHADELEALLKKLGYKTKGSAYSYDKRKVLFLGDYIDRGPKIKRVLEIVRSMVESQDAIALMGNHEFNAICFNTKFPGSNKYLRPQTVKNINQHKATLLEFEDDMDTYDDYIKWFKGLPVFFENDEFRAVHATWRDDLIGSFKVEHQGNQFSSDQGFFDTFNGTQKQKNYAEILLKGEELRLPKGISFQDKDNNERKSVRIKWWLDAQSSNWQDYAMPYLSALPTEKVAMEVEQNPNSAKPVFFGHYWLEGKPILQTPNVCCLDYSVAKGGSLVAYRSDGKPLNESNLVSV